MKYRIGGLRLRKIKIMNPDFLIVVRIGESGAGAS